MKDWPASIKAFYENSGVTEEPWIGPPASEQAISDFETTMGLKVSEEFRSLYRQCDGTNATSELRPGSYFGFIPIHRLPSFIEAVRGSFTDEHPVEAHQFYPFYDSSDGDDPHILGFMFSEEYGLDPELFLFWRGGADGKTVFLLPCEDSVEAFLRGEDTQSEQDAASNGG
jgi:hypothetical protein